MSQDTSIQGQAIYNLDALALVFVPNVGGGKTTNRVDFLGAALLAAGPGAPQTVLERGQEDDWFQSTEIIVLSLIGAPGLAAFIAWKLSIPHPIASLWLLKNRSLAAGSLFSLVIGVGLYATTYLLPIFLQSARGHTAYETGMSLLPSALLSALLSAASFVIAGPLSQKTDACGLSLGFLFIPMTVASLGGLKSSEIGEESASAGSRHC